MAITDLTGYTWTCTSTNATAGYGQFNINYYGAGYEPQNFYGLLLGYQFNPRTGYTSADDFCVMALEGNIFNNYLSEDDSLTFTGGTDATNTDLISWLESNGTLIAPISSNNYEITHSLTNLTYGNITLQITPDSGYTYPSNIAVTNGTLVSYDNTTGVLVVSGDDTTTISCSCPVAPSGYSGNITTTLLTATSYKITYIKFGSAPSSSSDYDSFVSIRGTITGATSYTDQTKAYIWGGGGVVINGTQTRCSDNSYSSPIEIILTGNYDISLLYAPAQNLSD